jgi:hypothetical protein
MLVHSPSFHPSFSSHFAVKLWGSPVAEDQPSGAFGAPEIPWYLKPFRAKTYTDFIGGQFEAGDNKDLLSGIPQATAFAKAAASPLETAKTIGQGAWDFIGKPAVEGAQRSLVAQEGEPLFDDGGKYVSGAKMEKLDPFNAASIAPIGAFGARAAGLTDEVAKEGAKSFRAYHGSPRAIEGPFLGAGDSMFVATDPALASAYASMHVGGRASPNVMPLDVTFENLMPPGAYKARDLDKFGGVSIQDYARARGHDGVDYGDGVYASVKPGTVRSATTGDLIFSNDESAALPGTIINAASELPMDQASRLARAKEMGFDVDNPLFHGTTKKFDEFADRPTFFAPERGVAAAYAKPYSGPRGEVGEYFIKPGNQADFVGAGGDILRRVAGEIGVPSSKLREALDQGSLYNYFDEDTEAGFFSALKSLGYDSAKLPDAHPYTGAITESVVALDPKNIRSVNAAFDPSKSDSAFLLAANDKNASLPALVTNALEQQPQGIKAYHGSPHDFDRFDLSKIGTGEGAQAYGHGLYFAESEDVARAYRDALSRPGPSGDAGADLAQFQFSNARGDASKAAQYLRNEMGYYDKKGWPTPDYRLQYEDALARLERGDFQAPGRMYEVNINAQPEQFLDWDAPLSGQSEAVRSVLERLAQERGIPLSGKAANGVDWELGPSNLYDRIATKEGGVAASQAIASQRLREAGIPGIRYYDQGSRGAGEGTRNYVLFDDSLVDITRKYANHENAALPSVLTNMAEQGKPQRAYHGTSGNLVGPMQTPTKSINETTFGPVETERHGPFFSDNPDYAAEHGNAIYPVDIYADNVADLTRDMHLDFADSIDPFENRDLWLSAKHNPGGWHLFEGERGAAFTDWLRGQGYDAARFAEDLPSGVEGTTTVPLLRGMVKSATTGETLFGNPSIASIPSEVLNLYDRLPERAFAPERDD